MNTTTKNIRDTNGLTTPGKLPLHQYLMSKGSLVKAIFGGTNVEKNKSKGDHSFSLPTGVNNIDSNNSGAKTSIV